MNSCGGQWLSVPLGRAMQLGSTPRASYAASMNKPVVFGILGGLAWFVVGLLVGHYIWT